MAISGADPLDSWTSTTWLLLIYAGLLMLLIFHSADDSRRALARLDSSLGVELPEQEYGTDCELYSPNNPISPFANLNAVLFDIFILPHAFGWICGRMLLRDWKLSWVLSIAFEFYELTFAHWLPNFDECWWDHVLVDVLICNAFGIFVGGWLLERWHVPEFDWLGLAGRSSSLDCAFLTSFSRFVQVLMLVAVVSGSCACFCPVFRCSRHCLRLWCLHRCQ